MSLVLLAALFGCETFPPSGYQGDLSGGDDAVVESPIADFSWGTDALTLEITGGVGYDFNFGLIESGDCENDDVLGCWTGESCLGVGYISPDGSTTIEAQCHPAGSSGARLEYTAGGVASVIADRNLLQVGQTTAFENANAETSVTYYLVDTVSTNCWVWGYDPSVYDELSAVACSIPDDAR